ncbi:uncharacterized protein [Drosophila bipectinata]|uniref:uncharacterized protein n=1 Tax=Drosophila bipectinata TaxID=42026 RepID=UPI0007E7F98B|nr:uncharacterized protein LOC108132045 [Drosophila bipectinata]
MLGLLSVWFILYIFDLIQGRSVGGLDDLEGVSVPRPDSTIFVFNQTDKEFNFDYAWN